MAGILRNGLGRSDGCDWGKDREYVSVIMSEMMCRKERGVQGGWNNRLASLQRAGSQQEGMVNCMIAFQV